MKRDVAHIGSNQSAKKPQIFMAGTVNTQQQKGSSKNSKGNSMPIWKIFKFADCVDVLMMVLGTLGSIVDGYLGRAGVLIILSRLINSLGSDPRSVKHGDFHNTMNKVIHFQTIYFSVLYS